MKEFFGKMKKWTIPVAIILGFMLMAICFGGSYYYFKVDRNVVFAWAAIIFGIGFLALTIWWCINVHNYGYEKPAVKK